jgi:PTS system ascorbate-specific IIA component
LEHGSHSVSASTTAARDHKLKEVHVLHELLTTETIRVGVEAEDWEEVVEITGELLLDSGAIEPSYIRAMKETIEELGPYVVLAPGIALLHSRPEGGVNRICMSLAILDPPVEFGHPDNDPVDLAFALGGVDESSHMEALRQLAESLSQEPLVARLRHVSSAEEAATLFREWSESDA